MYRFAYLLQICQVFIVGGLKHIAKSVVIGNVPHSQTLVLKFAF